MRWPYPIVFGLSRPPTVLSIFLVLLFLTSGIWGRESRAAESVTILFEYPGGEGDEASASNLMGILAESLSRLSGVSVVAEYHPTRRDPGKVLPPRDRPRTLVLIRVDTYLEWREAGLKLEPVLITEPAFNDGGAFAYHVYGVASPAASSPPPSLPCEKLYMGADLKEKYVQALFGAEWKKVPMIYAGDPLEKLEAIAQSLTAPGGPSKECMLLESRQWQALKTVPFPWKENLVLVKESLPTLNPLLFRFDHTEVAVDKVIGAMQKISEDEANRDLLSELQSNAFVPLSADQLKRLAEWESRYDQTAP